MSSRAQPVRLGSLAQGELCGVEGSRGLTDAFRYGMESLTGSRNRSALRCSLDCARNNQIHYFFISSSTAVVIAIIPVRIVGSGTGANLLECKLGRCVPVLLLSAIFSGATAPT